MKIFSIITILASFSRLALSSTPVSYPSPDANQPATYPWLDPQSINSKHHPALEYPGQRQHVMSPGAEEQHVITDTAQKVEEDVESDEDIEFDNEDFEDEGSDPDDLDPSDINYDDPNYGTLLIKAIQALNLNEITKLLSRGADPNTVHTKYLTPVILRKNPKSIPIPRHPLDFAALTCSPDVFKVLLSKGANIALSNPLHCVAGARTFSSHDERIAMLTYFLDDLKLDINSIEYASDPTTVAAWKFLRDDVGDELGGRAFGTPLHKAAGSGWVEGVRFLLERGADKGVVDSEGRKTALDWQLDNEVGEGGYNRTIIDMLTPRQSG